MIILRQYSLYSPYSLGALSVMASNPSPSRVAPLPTPYSLPTSLLRVK
ncbi:hypothetical protein BJP36_43795 [Moorena producens JHB]|uniref:Uncharacterized protein n=1 Tax=Moorena producens (strain JHB) TaxID=1454205 RepID=A0A9Q9STC3_MOOP1|nr:hypothetical protein [Moorena producens]WAN69285.1 hypothetical protein BJP36_43795 [Moorena producens JHB]